METKTFTDYSEVGNLQIEVNKSITNNLKRWEKGKNYAVSQFTDINMAKAKLVSVREKTLYNLNGIISKFEKNFLENNGKLFIVPSTKEVSEVISRIIKDENIDKVLLSKSSTLEEIDIQEILNKKVSEITYTNIGEHIEKLVKSKSSHIVSSTLEYNIEEILDIVNEKYPIEDKTLTHEKIAQLISDAIKKKIPEADAVISGANAVIADTGSLVVLENEGDVLKSSAFSKTHIIIAGIDALFGQAKDMDILFPMLSSFSVGQKMFTYGTLISPSKERNLYVILYNNNRTEFLKNNNLRATLRCVKCGACSNVCPVYKKVGGYAYDNAYPGPYGIIASPYMESMKNYKHLPYTTVLCGKCTEICPVNIDIHNNIIKVRNEIVKKDINAKTDISIFDTLYSKTIKRRKMNGFSHTIKVFKYKRMVRKLWGQQRELPVFARASFSKQFSDKLKSELKNDKKNQKNNEL